MEGSICYYCQWLYYFDINGLQAQKGLEETNPGKAKEMLDEVSGYIVDLPLHFLEQSLEANRVPDWLDITKKEKPPPEEQYYTMW